MPYKRMLVPLDGSQGGWKAFRRALILAGEMEAEVTVLSVEEHLPHYAATVGEVEEEKEQENEYFGKLQNDAVLMARAHGIDLKTRVVAGHAAQAIVRHAEEEGIDLIVIGQVGHSSVWGRLLGSSTGRVVDHAPCDVLVVR